MNILQQIEAEQVEKVSKNMKIDDFKPGDVGVVPKSQGHYIQNTGPDEIQMLIIFKAPEYQEVDLADWLTHAPPELVAQQLNIDPAVIARFPKDQLGLMPG